jgi:inner membrane protein
MPTPIAHGLAGYAFLIFAEPKLASDFRGNLKAMGTGFFFGSLADADFFVAYYSKHPVLQHHYFTHSIFFALLIGLTMYLVLRALRKSHPLRTAMILTAVYGTHLLLDYFTNDGSRPIGIPLLWPLSHKHFIAPVEFFLSIHRGSMDVLFGPHNFKALLREILILGPFAVAAYWRGRNLNPFNG